MASIESQGYMEAINLSMMMSDSTVDTNSSLLRASVQTDPSFHQCFASSCTVASSSPIPGAESSSAAECPWLESSSKASLSTQYSVGNTRQPGGYLVPSEFSSAVQDVSLLSHFQTPGLQVVTLSNLESSPAEPHQENISSSSTCACLSYSGTRDSSSLREDTQATCIGNANASKTVTLSVASADDNDFLTQSFLTVASGHNSQNSAVLHHHGGNLHAQPPLPEKKRSSEGERSFASVSPSSSGFSSPHSGSTISIPFPNVLPDFSKMLSPSPVPENTADKHVTVKFVQDTSKFWYKPDISREQDEYL